MQIDRLAPTEVANAATLPTDKKREYLLSVGQTQVSWGYQPTNNNLPKLLRCDGTLFGTLPADDDSKLLARVRRACRSGDDQIAANVAVAAAIIDWRNEHGVVGRLHYSDPFKTTVDDFKYCSDVVVVKDGRIWVICPDWRSSLKLTVPGREFMKSIIHHSALIGDLRDAGVAILRTPKVGKGKRKAFFEELTGPPTYSVRDVQAMVRETYSIWETILRARRSGTAATGRG